MTEMISAQGLVKRYGDITALDEFDLAVPEGSILGVLGPNGAGKTTAVRVVSTLLKPDSGTATVAGIDVIDNPAGVREKIGLSGQSAAVDEYLTGKENLDMVGQLYGMNGRTSRSRADELLTQFDLSDAGNRMVKTYSGGMRRRLDLAAALVARPPVLFLDEPTTGLDPRSRNDLWDVIRVLVKDGTTVLLTTQYLEEADKLADDIIVMDHGRMIAQGDADQLKDQVGGERIELTVEHATDLPAAAAVLERVAVGDVRTQHQSRQLTAPITGGAQTLRAALNRLDDAGISVLDFGLRRPTLDDVFLSLTGRATEENPATQNTALGARR
ncbi:daunorubicin resistance protein DrrA family ABC transporter ATP-binding protein [soil metagenome]